MTAVNPFDASPVPVLPPETTPAAIRDALIDEERAAFERAYRDAITEAAQTLDLTKVLDVLRNYHRIAWITQRQGAAAHRRMLDKAAAIMETGTNPNGIPVDDVRARVRERLGEQVFHVIVDEDAASQIDALPVGVLRSFADALG